MKYSLKDKMRIGVLIMAVVAGGITVAMVREGIGKSQSQVEGANDRINETSGVLLPVVGKLEYQVPTQPPIESMAPAEEREAILKEAGTGADRGVARSKLMEDKQIVSLEAGLPSVPAGKAREGWLVKDGVPPDYFSLGWLSEEERRVRLTAEIEDAKRDYRKVIVTEETEKLGQDGVPERLILEGIFAE